MENMIDKIGKKARQTYRNAAEATGRIAKEIKLKSQMADCKAQIRDLYEKIGKNVYEKYVLKEKLDVDTNFKNDCDMIDILANEVEDIRLELLSLKDLKQCPKCHYEIELDFHFCPNCGEEQHLPEKAKQNDGPATLETTDEEDKILTLDDFEEDNGEEN